MAKLYFRHGVMAAAKTSNLLQVEFTYSQAGMKTILAKPAVDSKGGPAIVSRIGLSKDAELLIDAEMNVKEVMQKLIEENREAGTPLACLLIDEAQFLSPKQVDQLLWLTVFEDLPVLAYGLRSDFLTQAFPGSARLLTVAHSIEEVKTVCPHDGRKALFNARKDKNGNFISNGDQVAIDGEGVTYESICPKCFMEKVAPLA